MKKLIFILAFAFLSGNLFAQTIQEKDIPEVVKNQFKAKFPQQTTAKWAIEDSLYEAEFTSEGMNIEVSIDMLGNWKETEWDIPKEYTPAKIKEYITANYAGYKTKEVCISDTPADGKMYHAEVTKKKTEVELVFTLQGEFKEIYKPGCQKEKVGCDPKCPHHK